MDKLNKIISWTVIASESTHVFCCVLPSVVSVLSLLTGMGLLSGLPVGLQGFHDFMHDYEVPLILGSGIILALGWGLHALSLKLDCRAAGCGHEPCAPKKTNTSKILIGATLLFTVNMMVYMALHSQFAIIG